MTQFASTRIFTDNVDDLIAFYEAVTGIASRRLHPLFGVLETPLGTLAIASTQTVSLLGDGAAEAGANRSVCLDFLVDDVDALVPRLREIVADFVSGPTELPWGNRSLLFRDPDGNLINFFTPTTAAARERFGLQ
ncbi:VOC family protein [Subtercola lobariae]|uniref:Glyoxalase n=1 Tax=Subtercola lobariae TaxID=1588641 RepID=A0A917B858_9MICO|nr:VOC family protein [Subtercola lobariae]GGF27789.1 glyoxalase [Subtercola lobariae]